MSRRANTTDTGESGATRDARAEHLEKMLDAAHEVVLREGMGRLTIEAVAKVAGLSKAGLLHHFPSKDALVLAMVNRHINRWRSEFLDLRERLRLQGHTSPTTAAMMGLCMSGRCVNDEDERTGNRVLIAALVHDEKHIEPLRRLHDEIASMVDQDALKPGAGELVHLAVHGLWLGMIFGFKSPSESRLSKVRGTLQEMLDEKSERSTKARVSGGRGGAMVKAGRGGADGPRGGAGVLGVNHRTNASKGRAGKRGAK